jgi:hypothetical protein
VAEAESRTEGAGAHPSGIVRRRSRPALRGQWEGGVSRCSVAMAVRLRPDLPRRTFRPIPNRVRDGNRDRRKQDQSDEDQRWSVQTALLLGPRCPAGCRPASRRPARCMPAHCRCARCMPARLLTLRTILLLRHAHILMWKRRGRNAVPRTSNQRGRNAVSRTWNPARTASPARTRRSARSSCARRTVDGSPAAAAGPRSRQWRVPRCGSRRAPDRETRSARG